VNKQCANATGADATHRRSLTLYVKAFMVDGMDEITFQIRRVQRFVDGQSVTKTKLALTAGLPITTLIGMERLDWNPRSSTLRALVRAIDKLESDAAKKKARDELRRQQEAAA